MDAERKLGTIGNQKFNRGSRFAFQKGHSGFWVGDSIGKVEVVGYFDGLGVWPGSKREPGG